MLDTKTFSQVRKCDLLELDEEKEGSEDVVKEVPGHWGSIG